MPRQVLFKGIEVNQAAGMRMTCLHMPPYFPPQRAVPWTPSSQLPLETYVPNRPSMEPNNSHGKPLIWLSVSCSRTLLACTLCPQALTSL